LVKKVGNNISQRKRRKTYRILRLRISLSKEKRFQVGKTAERDAAIGKQLSEERTLDNTTAKKCGKEKKEAIVDDREKNS